MNKKTVFHSILFCLLHTFFWQSSVGIALPQSEQQLLTPDPVINQQSNTFHIAYEFGDGKDAELLIFLASLEKKRVELTIDKSLLGAEKQLAYFLDAGEAKLLRIVKGMEMPEWAPMYFKPVKPPRAQINLNHDWKFVKGDVPNAQSPATTEAAWEPVTLPHTWNAADVFDHRNINDGLDIYSSYWRGSGWYRRQFVVGREYSDKKLFIKFEAANQVADVWLNGFHLGQHIGGYLGFQFEATNAVRFDQSNLLAVKVDNRYNYDIPPHCADFNMMGGITREVWLEITEKASVVSTYITTPEISPKAATVNIVTEARNDTDKGFFFNGQYLKLQGANLHQDQFAMGSAVPDSLRIKDLRLLKRMGINFIRLAHYPHDPVMLDECDRLGIIVWEEIPWVNTVGREKFTENAKYMLREMIRRDRNHPAVVFWGIANETAEPYLAETEVPYKGLL